MAKQTISIFWHRRDLRLNDNRGLHKALSGDYPVLPLFIFDWNILNALDDSHDARVLFIHQEIQRLQEELKSYGSSMLVRYGKPENVWSDLLDEYDIKEVYTNRDYEPYAQQRDKMVHDMLSEHDIPFKGAKDHVILEKSEVTKDDGDPYSVFTPYMKKWKATVADEDLAIVDTLSKKDNFFKTEPLPCPTLNEMGFEEFEFEFPDRDVDADLLERYGDRRDIPSVRGTSRLSMHLRFGTVSIRALAQKGYEHSEKWLNELIWRDFYQMFIYHNPQTPNESFKPKYDRIPWINDEEQFQAWCEGRTGYPIVDAGMRELNKTGFMHNRVRMIVASFLTKHLLIDWRWGERYFAKKLLDFELASNVGGWQWASGGGADAAPYFRVFNPTSQEKKFDPDRKYIRKWVPEVDSSSYPKPIVEHKMARERAISTYKEALN